MGWNPIKMVTNAVSTVGGAVVGVGDALLDTMVIEGKLQDAGFTVDASKRLADSSDLLAVFKTVNEQRENITDTDKLAAAESLGKNWVETLNENPSLISELNEQLRLQPPLKELLVSQVKNNPVALEGALPQIVDDPQNLADIVQNLPAAETLLTASSVPEEVELVGESKLDKASLVNPFETAAEKQQQQVGSPEHVLVAQSTYDKS